MQYGLAGKAVRFMGKLFWDIAMDFDLAKMYCAIIRLVPVPGEASIAERVGSGYQVLVLVKQVNDKVMDLSDSECIGTMLLPLSCYWTLYDFYDIDEIDVSNPDTGSDLRIQKIGTSYELRALGESPFEAPVGSQRGDREVRMNLFRAAALSVG